MNHSLHKKALLLALLCSAALPTIAKKNDIEYQERQSLKKDILITLGVIGAGVATLGALFVYNRYTAKRDATLFMDSLGRTYIKYKDRALAQNEIPEAVAAIAPQDRYQYAATAAKIKRDLDHLDAYILNLKKYPFLQDTGTIFKLEMLHASLTALHANITSHPQFAQEHTAIANREDRHHQSQIDLEHEQSKNKIREYKALHQANANINVQLGGQVGPHSPYPHNNGYYRGQRHR